MFDIIFLSFDEINADERWEIFQKRFPWSQRVHGIQGIYNAHKEAACVARTSMFWVVDADCAPIPSFDFSFNPDNKNIVHVWYALNPVNGLQYGFGGIKLFLRRKLLETTGAGIDVATSIFSDIVIIEKVASITKFNTTPFVTWRSAFRENVKLFANLTNGIVEENEERMQGWLTCISDAPFGEYAVAGAKAGQEYARNNISNTNALCLINDYKWLKERFDNSYGNTQNS